MSSLNRTTFGAVSMPRSLAETHFKDAIEGLRQNQPVDPNYKLFAECLDDTKMLSDRDFFKSQMEKIRKIDQISHRNSGQTDPYIAYLSEKLGNGTIGDPQVKAIFEAELEEAKNFVAL